MYTHHIFFIYLSFDEYQDWFHKLATRILLQYYGYEVSQFYANLDYFRYLSSSGIAGSFGNFLFRFLKNIHTDFYSGYCNLHSQLDVVVFFFPNILNSVYCCLFLDNMHLPSRGEIES
jgi:hypothetical protein